MSWDDVICPPGVAREWWPVDPHGSPWMQGRPPIEFAREYVVACGPELLRAADHDEDASPFLGDTIPPSARRRPAVG